ncbi:MAG: RNA polymerase factor sigma-54 [Chitinophagaceae bacterium]|nr:RNA polymerase factor sigma-54 [Chitinophagaceae bacterium]
MLSQNQSQRQQMRILPKQIQLLNIFHLNTLQLEQKIMDEINENPLLEELPSDDVIVAEKNAKDAVQDYMGYEEYCHDDIPDYKLEHKNYFTGDNIPERPIATSVDFREELKQQFREENPDDANPELADYVIDSLSDCGLLEQTLSDLATSISFSFHKWFETEELEELLVRVQNLGPAGIGARNLRECFLLQLRHMNQKRPDVRKAITILEDFYSELQSCNMEKIKNSTNLEDDELKIVVQLIASLQTRPVSAMSNSADNGTVIPDFIITETGEGLEVSLFRSRSASLYINNSWKETVHENEQNKSGNAHAAQYIKSKLQSAQWFVNAIQERESNMLKVMRCILHHQEIYFQTGNMMDLKPMILKDIAEKTNLDISTISRIASNKYASTPFGILLLKKLFSEGLATQDGEKVSNRVIQQTIKEIVINEDKKNPYTDKQITAMLADKGFNVARRTVAKYREQLHIPVAQQRSRWPEMTESATEDVSSMNDQLS